MIPMRLVLLFIFLISCGLDFSVSKYIQSSNRLQSQQLDSSNNILEPGKICLTKTCKDTAWEISRNMDFTADPCNDFYQFACGGYIKSANIPDNSKNISVFHENNKIVMNQLEKSLKEPITQNEPRPLKMVKAYFQSCMDESAIEKKSVESLLQVIKSFGGWPVIEGEKWNETNFDWIECIIELQKMGFIVDNMPFVFTKNNENNKTKRDIYVWRQKSSSLFPQGINDETIDIIREDLINITVEFGANRTFAGKEIRDLFSFISELNHLETDTDSSFHKLENFGAVNNSIGEFPERKYIEKLILPFFNIDNETKVFWMDSIYNLKTLMNNTSKRVQANYIIWSVVSQSVASLKNDIREKYIKLLEDGGYEIPIKKYSSRTEECIEATRQSMTASLLALYIRNHFDRNMKYDYMRMSEIIRKQIIKNLNGATQIENVFRDETKKVKLSIAYDGNFFNDTELEELDKDLDISSSNDYLQNNINLMRSMMKRYRSIDLQKSVNELDQQTLWNFLKNKKNWKYFNRHANLLYSLGEKPAFAIVSKTVVIQATYLQSVMNRIENPEYIKYGAMGYVLGHEFYHVINRHILSQDEYSSPTFWDDTSRKIFSKQEECLINQYGNYSLGGTKLDGKKLLRENTADNGGIKAAYLAYSNLASKRDEPELLLPNLPYTPQQLFWISVVNDFCEKQKDPNSYDFDDYHTPPSLRFLGVFSNMPEFAKDFNCSVGSKMNPSERCSVF